MEAKRQEAAAIVLARNDDGRRKKLSVRVRRLGRSERHSEGRTDGHAVWGDGC